MAALIMAMLSVISLFSTRIASASSIVASPASHSRKIDNCLPRIQNHRKDYERCKTEHCFLFMAETLFVSVPKSMKSEKEQVPFPCYRHHVEYPELSGLSFDILKETSSMNALCAWIGDNCTFNQVVYFMAAESKNGYRFTALTSMIETPERRKLSRLSTPFYEGRLILVGTRDGITQLSAIELLIGPFRQSAWIVVLLSIFVLAFLLLAIEWKFDRLGALREISFPNDDRKSEKSNTNGDMDSEKYQYVKNMHRLAVASFCAIVIIFYEAGVVNFLFKQSSAKLSKNLLALNDTELGEFGMEADQAVEDIFRDLVDPQKRFTRGNYPWHRCVRVGDCFKKLLDPSDKLKYVVTFTAEGDFLANVHGVHSKVASYKPDTDLYSLQTGFLHNLEVPEAFVMQLDIDLLHLQRQNKVSRLTKMQVGLPLLSSGDAHEDIGGAIIAIPLGIFLLPILIFIVWLLLAQRSKTIAKKVESEDSLEAEVSLSL